MFFRNTVVEYASFKVTWTLSWIESPSCPQSLTPFFALWLCPHWTHDLRQSATVIRVFRAALPSHRNFLFSAIIVYRRHRPTKVCVSLSFSPPTLLLYEMCIGAKCYYKIKLLKWYVKLWTLEVLVFLFILGHCKLCSLKHVIFVVMLIGNL